ncbi:hypothetical protein OG429_39275 [Streptomyces sp. NBC_00190]|uniref:hypothetical protein n=1 Tax=unclassified Streptomyces TaxID=2593676 RepID=UPI002E29FFE5|nr:hypothetical protein [Streptomyces sp. NBC_00190]WSZ37672.1 hypothetical protein OG239_01565 [Streptomyces sp. NBC_00868]
MIEAPRLLALAAEEGEGEVESVDVTATALGDSRLTTGEEVLLQRVQLVNESVQSTDPAWHYGWETVAALIATTKATTR